MPIRHSLVPRIIIFAGLWFLISIGSPGNSGLITIAAENADLPDFNTATADQFKPHPGIADAYSEKTIPPATDHKLEEQIVAKQK